MRTSQKTNWCERASEMHLAGGQSVWINKHITITDAAVKQEAANKQAAAGGWMQAEPGQQAA